jgi:hypothetical protein
MPQAHDRIQIPRPVGRTISEEQPHTVGGVLGPAGRAGRTLFDAARLSNHLSNGLHEVPYGSDDSIDRAWQVSDYPNCPTRNRPASARPKL